MKNIIRKITPEWPLRVGLGLVYLYSGFDLFRHPTAWTWALPPWFKILVGSVVPIEDYLKFQGVVELILAFVFLAWFLPRMSLQIAAAISSLELLFILLFAPYSQFIITFRDLGVLGAALALFIISLQKPSFTGQKHGSTNKQG